MQKQQRKAAEKALKRAKKLEKARKLAGFIYVRANKNTIILTNKF